MAKDMGYVKNVVKEVKQTARRASNALAKKDRKKYEEKYGRKIDIKIGKSNVKDQAGQLAGAVLQGRRYNEAGKQITPKMTNKKNPNKTATRGAAVAKKAAMPKPTPVKLPTVKGRPGAKGTRDEMVKSVRVLGGTGYAQERFDKAVKRTSSVGQSVTPRKNKMK